ncbi:MAG: alanine--tRNA ligase [Candidatus Micrarchaeia archaeon]
MEKAPKLDKEKLRVKFSEDYNRYYGTELFEREGFKRRKCKICGKYFWSIEDREVCDDPIHTPYSFFKEKPVEISYVELWSKFSDFFKKNGHEEIPRYPVVSRWRPDLYFTIADIQDFQRIENGRMSFEYPANPLIVPQMCLRFNDIENVGVTGGHFTGFMMAGQKAFNYPKEGYWRDQTIDLNYKFLTEVLNIKKEKIVYSEDVWAMGDFSEFGPCLESYSSGTELVDSVFTEFESSNGVVRELDGKVVDVGWGFERLLWFYTGYDNAYEATFHATLNKLRKQLGIDFDDKLYRKFATYAGSLNITEIKDVREKEAEILKRSGVSEEEYSKLIKPMQAVYAILDHTRTLLFAVSDGALPSNWGGGYNLRVILRRAFSFIENYNLDLDLSEVARSIASELHPLYPELSDNIEIFKKVVDIEKERYSKSKENARKIVESIIAKGAKITGKELKTLYESNGVTPEFISSIASSRNVKIEMPESSYEDIIEGDFAKQEKEPAIEINLPELPKTKQLYYDFKEDSKSKVLFAEGKHIVLDATPFYPEGGGQLADTGTIEGMRVKDVQKAGDVIVHIMEDDISGKIKKGAEVEAKVDINRRNQLIAHHTATHLITSAARAVLGKHAWQEGASKGVEKAHVDISHYDKLSDEEVRKIESIVNRELREGIKVSLEELDRGTAESKYGFTIYQGHGVPAKQMRIIVIRSMQGKLIDAEACGGLHAIGRENLIGMVKIINTYRIHDGVDRIEFVAGEAALKRFQAEHSELVAASQLLNSEVTKVAEAIEKLKEANRNFYKDSELYADAISEIISSYGAGKEVIEHSLEVKKEALRKIASKVAEKNSSSIVLLTNSKKEVVCMAGSNSKKSAIDFVKSRFGSNFKGGGSSKAAEGVA